jgi:tetratricopeptide (TPR) repeat protein
MNALLIFIPLLASISPLYDAGEFTQAAVEFEKILNEPLTPQQHATVLYNIGTSLLAQGDFEKAIEQFRAINLDANTSPLLEQNLHANQALALLQHAEQLIDRLNQKDDSKKCDQPLLLVYRANQHLLLAQQASERLTQLGAASTVLETIPEIKQRLDNAAQKIITLENSYIQNHPPSFTAPDKQTQLFKTIEHLFTNYQKALLQVPLQEQEVRELAFDTQNFELPDYISKDLKEIAVLQQTSLQYIQKNQDIPARLLLNISSATLKLILSQLSPQLESTPIALLRQIIETQQFALHVNETITALEMRNSVSFVKAAQQAVLDQEGAFVQSIFEQQKRFFNIPSTNDQVAECHKKWKEAMSYFYIAHDSSENALKALTNSQPLAATLSQKDALRYLKLALDKLQQSTKSNQTDSTIEKMQSDQDRRSQDLWMLLDQMEADDSQLDKPKKQSSQPGERPW